MSSRSRLLSSLPFVAAAFAPLALHAQRAMPAAQVSMPIDTTTWGNLQWRNIGPNSAGRMVAVAGSAARPNEYYFGTTGGGVWKTTDGGTTLEPVTDKYFGGSIGAIAVSESNPDIVYVGGGESPIRGNVSHGDGVWKSTDAGKTWTYLGLKETQQISRVRIDPTNPDIVYVGALGHVWGPNPERGVFKTVDGGKTWKKILFRNDSTGISDMIIDPSQSATSCTPRFWQAGRKPWLLISGGNGSGIFKTTDGGDHWTEITRNPGLPKGIDRPHRHRGIAGQAEPGLGAHRERARRRRLPLRRWWRHLDRAQRQPRPAAARLVLLQHLRRSGRHQRRLCPQRRSDVVEGRRQDLRARLRGR